MDDSIDPLYGAANIVEIAHVALNRLVRGVLDESKVQQAQLVGGRGEGGSDNASKVPTRSREKNVHFRQAPSRREVSCPLPLPKEGKTFREKKETP